MGGWGSGRWDRYGARPLAEHCLHLDEHGGLAHPSYRVCLVLLGRWLPL